MTQAQHTPGPWVVFQNGMAVGESTGGGICAMWEQANIAETKANARLIAAAPELNCLAALVVEHFENIETNDALTEHEQKILIAARAAIAKAEGGAS